jgi:GNAT superfamily N-acetyltransferase
MARVLVAASGSNEAESPQLLGVAVAWRVAGDAQVMELAVRPAWRRRGLGGALPALAACHTACVSLWIWAVSSLAHHHGHLLSNLRPRRGPLAAVVPADAVKVPEVSYTDGPACDILDAAAMKAAASASSA